jgi:ribosomal protein S12 methylthiotransferase accessory factor YcaO
MTMSKQLELDADCAKAVAQLCIGLPDDISSGDLLRVVAAAWRSGYHAGFLNGCQAGTKATAAAFEAVTEALA